MLNLIAAMSKDRVIGYKGRIPWRIPGELAYFKQMTTPHIVVMGRITYESIGEPLRGRTNYVLTRNPELVPLPDEYLITEPDSVLKMAITNNVFINCGRELYRMFLPPADRVYLTVVHEEFEGDTFFPKLDDEMWELVESEDGPSKVILHTFNVYRKISL